MGIKGDTRSLDYGSYIPIEPFNSEKWTSGFHTFPLWSIPDCPLKPQRLYTAKPLLLLLVL